MSFPPEVWIDPAHMSRDAAPDGEVRLHVHCSEGDACAADGEISVVLENGSVLAAGAVRCTNAKEPHSLPIAGIRELETVRVRVRFSCAGQEGTGWEGRIWVQSTRGAPAGAARRAAAAKRPSRKQPSRKPVTRPTAGARVRTDVEGGDAATRKTTRPVAEQRREPEPAVTASDRIGRRLDAFPDRVDVRDWPYQPRLTALPSRVVNCHRVPKVLDQGQEGACTGFAQAAVINFLLHSERIGRFVSPHMLYELARKYDEWPGEGYEGSSARGAMIGWARHGVCQQDSWDGSKKGIGCLNDPLFTVKKGKRVQLMVDGRVQTCADEARGTPGGAFYRVQHGNARDMHAALAEVGILYCTLMVHSGWSAPGPDYADVPIPEAAATRRGAGTARRSRAAKPKTWRIPIIRREDRATDGHAVAIVGYTDEGFIIQNSWGEGWGYKGFALLPYADFLLHVTDVWAMQVGVPVKADLWQDTQNADTTAGIQRVSQAVPLDTIRPFVIDVGNNGELSDSGDYWTTEDDIERMFAEVIPKATSTWSKRRILLYLHGGLNDERSAARRIVAFRDVMLANEIYPIHIMWESGAMESLNGIIRDNLTDVDERAGGPADWLRKMRDHLVEAKDRSLELTLSRPGSAFWREMKENAKLASGHPDNHGAMQIVCSRAKKALEGLSPKTADSLELHVVGHSAGSIFAAHAMPLLLETGIRLATLQFLAPAITVEQFRQLLLPLIEAERCPSPTCYVLSDAGERDDNVGPYGKSLLFLVSNAFEGERDTPLLGMERFISDKADGVGGRFAQPDLLDLFKRAGPGSLVVAGAAGDIPRVSRSESHGGFDNDPATMNSVIYRVLGKKPDRAFDLRDLRY